MNGSKNRKEDRGIYELRSQEESKSPEYDYILE